jgi:flagellar protein FliL
MAKPEAPPVEVDDAGEAASAGKSKKKLLVLLALVVLLMGGGGAAAWYFMMREDTPKVVAEQPPKAPVFLALETFTVNLQGGDHYLQADITLQVADQIQVDTLKQHMPRVRSRLLTLLSSKHPDELTTPEHKLRLALEIMEQVKHPLHPNGKPQLVDDVLFTSFVIQ